MFAKRDYWERQFKNVIPMMISIWWVEDNNDRLESILERMSLKSLMQTTNGKISSKCLAEFVLNDNEDIPLEILRKYEKSSEPEMNKIYHSLTIPNPHNVNTRICSALWAELCFVVADFIKKSKWMKKNSRSLKKEAHRYLLVKGVLHK